MLTVEQYHEEAMKHLEVAEQVDDMWQRQVLVARARVHAELAKTAHDVAVAEDPWRKRDTADTAPASDGSHPATASWRHDGDATDFDSYARGWDAAREGYSDLQDVLGQIAGQIDLLGSADPHEAVARVRVLLTQAGRLTSGPARPSTLPGER